jgi:hypothetical protein
MMNRRSVLAIFFVMLSLSMAGESEAGGGLILDHLESWLQPKGCVFCGRPLLADMKVAFRKENEEAVRMACCMRCVITEAEQTGSTIYVLWVSDFATRKRLRPDQAVYVVGGAMSPDSAPLTETSPSRREQTELLWDRCLPSVIAFGNIEDALQFQRRSGGEIQTFEKLVAGVKVVSSFQPQKPERR